MVLRRRVGREDHDVRHAIVVFPVFHRYCEIHAGTDLAETAATRRLPKT